MSVKKIYICIILSFIALGIVQAMHDWVGSGGVIKLTLFTEQDEKILDFFDAITQNDIRKLKDMLNHGFNPNWKSHLHLHSHKFPKELYISENTPLTIAIYQAKPQIVELLLHHGADVNQMVRPSVINEPVLHHIIQLIHDEKAYQTNKHDKLLQILKMIANTPTVDLEALDNGGKTALDIAKEYNLKEAGQILIAALAKKRGQARLEKEVFEKLEKEHKLPWELVDIIKEYRKE